VRLYATRGGSQVALGTVRAPAQMVLKMLALRARALFQHVARYHLSLLLSVPLCAWDGWREGRVERKEMRRFSKVRIRWGR
jgi:hypothetical protein